jgi:predicted metal-dependent hydrolase
MLATSTAPSGPEPLPVRRVSFTYDDDFEPMWVPHHAELAAAANAISLGMPYAEPLFIRAVRSAYDRIDDDLRARTETYIRQETGHHTQHKRFNDLVSARYPATVGLQRLMARHANWVGRRSSRFRVAYAAGGETISYAVARWTESHLSAFRGADPVPTTLFLWHLAEEVEHKANTYDVFEATDGSRLRYAWAMTWGFTSLVLFTIVGALVQLRGERRLLPSDLVPPRPAEPEPRVRAHPDDGRVRPARAPPERLRGPGVPPGLARAARPGHRLDAGVDLDLTDTPPGVPACSSVRICTELHAGTLIA